MVIKQKYFILKSTKTQLTCISNENQACKSCVYAKKTDAKQDAKQDLCRVRAKRSRTRSGPHLWIRGPPCGPPCEKTWGPPCEKAVFR
jgi:hypothetical protein